MLKAVIHGKAGRIEVDSADKRISWRQLFKSREDLLTSAIFTRWSYLSSETQNHLMRRWFDTNDGGRHDFTTFQDIQFWPQYDLSEVEGRKFVEPDVLIQFKAFNLLIEVKPPLGGGQYLEQWQNEIAGYFAWDGNEDKPLCFLAIGRIDAVDAGWFKVIMGGEHNRKPQMMHALKWKPVAESIFNLLDEEALSSQDHRILTDMLSALEIYGIRGHDYLWQDFAHCKRPLPKISLNALSLFSQKEVEDDEMMNESIHAYCFPEMMGGYNNINMELMKQWPI